SRAGGAFEPITTETEGASANEVDIEEDVKKLSLLQVHLFGVHRPDVVLRRIGQVDSCENRGPHRVILVVVPVEAVSAAGLEVVEPGEVGADRLHGLLVVR